ncbi:hypothetical protein G6F66_002458 [Rhizopus arrhizus]|nr:hypothetical protein G6F66_002458 [Rhizopus arrhizus]
MFGKQQKPAKDFDINDIDDLLNSNIEEDDNIDLNDPELLKQLQDLSSDVMPAAIEKPRVRKQIPVESMDIDIDSYATLATGDDDVHVELDEKDFSDPHLLNELSSLTNNQENPRKEGNEFTSNPTEDVTQSSNSHSYKEEETIDEDPKTWKEKAQRYQKMALEAKRNGDKKKAVELLRESKLYSQRYEELFKIQQAFIENNDHIDNHSSLPAEPVSSSPPELTVQEQSSPEKELPLSTVPQANSVELQSLLTRTISLQKEYKQAALHYKKIGNLAAAKQMVRISKDLLHTGIKLKNGEIKDTDSIQLPDAPDMSLGDGKMRQLNDFNSGAAPASHEQIEAELSYQINVCHNLALQNNNRQTKASKSLLDSQQDAYFQAEKAFSADLVSLRAHKGSLPALHYEQVNYVYKNVNDNIPSNMMEFKVIRATGLPTLDISTSLEPFVTWDFGGWPPENTAQASMNKGETPVQKGIEPEFDFSCKIPITRTNRLFLRYLQRKKLTVEVFHNKYTYGLFRRPVSLGKAVLSMDRLLTKSSISGSFDLVDSTRKKTGGKIEIEVNLREPLTGEDTVKRSERWLVLDAFGSNASSCLAAAKLSTGESHVSVAKLVVEDEAVSEPNAEEPKPESSQVTASAPVESKKTMVSASNGELEQAEEEFNSVDSIVSNMVLEHELAVVNAALSKSKAKEDFMDRKQALEIKMNMLVIQVQTGILDMETYLKDVEKRMEQDRRLALVFKKNNRLDLAKAALTRKKIMQDELDEARAAMAENDG